MLVTLEDSLFYSKPFYKRSAKRDKVNSTACASKKNKTIHRRAFCATHQLLCIGYTWGRIPNSRKIGTFSPVFWQVFTKIHLQNPKKKINFSSIFLETVQNIWQIFWGNPKICQNLAKTYFPKSISLPKGEKRRKIIQNFAEFRFLSYRSSRFWWQKSAYKKTKICQKIAEFSGNRNSASRVANALTFDPDEKRNQYFTLVDSNRALLSWLWLFWVVCLIKRLFELEIGNLSNTFNTWWRLDKYRRTTYLVQIKAYTQFLSERQGRLFLDVFR